MADESKYLILVWLRGMFPNQEIENDADACQSNTTKGVSGPVSTYRLDTSGEGERRVCLEYDLY
jgi:hypothetical protein